MATTVTRGASDDLFVTLAKTAPIMLWLAGTDAACVFVDETWLAFTGRTLKQELGDGWAEGIHPDDRQRVEDCYRTAFEARTPFSTEIRFRAADGSYRWILASGAPRFADGRFAGYIGSCVDMTRRKVIDDALHAADVAESLTTQERLRASEHQLRQLAAALQTARERERTALSRELHDELGQLLTSVQLEIARVTEHLVGAGSHAVMVDRLQSIVGMVDIAVATVRKMSADLRPAELDQLGLGAAIQFEADAMQRRTPLRIRVAPYKPESRLSADQSTTLFRIFQEALMNIVRHAGASTVRIRLKETARLFVLEIEDDGRGIKPEELTASSSIGVLGMRERAQLLGGTIDITGVQHKGTTVTVRMPLRSRRRRAVDNPRRQAASNGPRTSRR